MNNEKENNKPVVIVVDENSKPCGVEIRTLDTQFTIALKDAPGSYTWNDAMEKYRDQLPNKKQASIICAYINEINEALRSAGGKKLDSWYWTNAEYDANFAWLYHGSVGGLTYGHKRSTYSVRPVLAFKTSNSI